VVEWIYRQDAKTLRHRGLASTDEGAHKLFVRQRRQLGDIRTGPGQKLPGVVHPVYPGRFDLDIREPGALQLGNVLVLPQSACHAANPLLNITANLGRYVAPCDHVGDGKSPAWPKDPEGLDHDPVPVG